MLRRVVIGLAVLAALAAGALALVPVLIPAETVRARLAAEIEARTGWRVAFDGPVSLGVVPEIALSAERLRIESAPNAADALAADVERAAFGLALAPLLSGSIRLTDIVLERPVVRIVRGVAAAPDGSADDDASLAGRLASVSIDRLSVEDGLLVLRGPGGETRLDDLALTLAMPDPAGETMIDASGALDGRPVSLEARIASPLALVSGEAVDVSLDLEAPGRLPAPLALGAEATWSAPRLALRDVDLASGESRLSGAADVVLGGGAPAIDVRLAGPLLDLDALAPAGGGGAGGGETIDLSALGTVVGDVELGLERLRVAGREIAPALLRAQLEDDAATLAVDEAGIGGGRVSGEARIGRDGARARVSGSLAARALDVASLVPPGAPPVSGRLAADLRFALAGETMPALRASLNAAGRIALSEGEARIPALAALAQGGDAERLSALTLAVEITDLTRPVAVSGDAVWRGERIGLDGTLDARALVEGRAGALDLGLAAPRFEAGYRGTLAPGGALAGEASLRTGSLRDLLAWLGRAPSTPGGLGPFAVSGRLDVAPGAIGLAEARIALDGASGTGEARIVQGPRPRIEGRLALDRLDLNPYFGLSSDGGASGGALAGWSETPVDLSALRAVDVALDLSLGALVFRDIETGRVSATARLENGRLAAELQEIALYGGGGNGRVDVVADPAAPSLAARFAFADLDARSFLAAATGFERLEGRGSLRLDVSGSLVTQRRLMETLFGSAGFAFRDGAIRGVDVTSLARLLSTGIVDGWALAEGARTELYAVEASLAIENGIARTNDLRLVGPLVDMSGTGAVDLPQQRLAFTVEPRVAFQRGSGEGIELVGFGAPVRIEGPWARPRIYPDIAGVLQDPVGAYERLRAMGSGIFGIDAPSAGEALERAVGEEAARGIERLLGLPQPQPPAVTAAPAPSQPAPTDSLPPAAAAPSQDPPLDPPLDPTLDAARGLIDLFMNNR
ncbi:AsmA family protein [Salinarimonas ramus]|uniref:Membrane assembly protein AsmA n=1 Tax=Salinarimonas ramus TaxID=690164 RepID=A0A917V6E5_9HYPH|nr:AsmA family protein [Salinarimonas ramus]GGK44348.1 membrane assembly protein AsmA [Salinarimonas ramus]